jgi:valyl-tRNA synthetase
MNLDPRRLEGARNFANKLWQATRFILMNLEGAPTGIGAIDSGQLTLVDRWILSRIQTLTGEVTRLIDGYQYGEAGRQIRDFLWDEFCDWYIEAAKIRLHDDEGDKATARAVLVAVLEQALRLLHPFMPFVTEAIWQALPEGARRGPALIVAAWPEVDAGRLDAAAEQEMAMVIELIRAIRAVRTDYKVEPARRIAAQVAGGASTEMLAANRELLVSLARLDGEQLAIVAATEVPAQSAPVVVGDVVAYLPLAGMVDLAAERARLEKEITALEGRIRASEGKLAGPFAERAPAEVVQRERDNLAAMRVELAQVREQREVLGG